MNRSMQWVGLILSGLFYSHIGMAGPTVYIPLGSANQVIAIDAATDTITARYSGTENSHGLVATPDGEYLVAGSLNETPLKQGQPKDTPNSQLYFIHPAHGHVMSTIPVPGWTHHLAITPDGRYVISTHGLRGYVTVVDLQTNQVVKTIRTGPAPNYTIITRDGLRAYVSNTGNNTLSEIDLKNWRVTRTLEAGPGPEHLAFSGDESKIFAANPRAGVASVVSVKSGRVVGRYAVGKGAHGLDIGDDGKTLFISSKQAGLLVAIDTTGDRRRELKLPSAPYHLNTIRGAGKIYVSSRNRPLIWVVDQKTLKLVNTITLPGGEAHQMAIVF